MVRRLLFLSSFYFLFIPKIIAQCPSYASAPSGALTACNNQPFVFNVPNTICTATMSFVVSGNSGSSFAYEIGWEIVNIASGAVVASGGNSNVIAAGGGNEIALPFNPGAYANNTTINVAVGPLAVSGANSSFMLYVYDDYGDGFNGIGGNITVSSLSGIVLASTSGDFGAEMNSAFFAPFNVSNANATITCSDGQSFTGLVLSGCSALNKTITFANANFFVPLRVLLSIGTSRVHRVGLFCLLVHN